MFFTHIRSICADIHISFSCTFPPKFKFPPHFPPFPKNKYKNIQKNTPMATGKGGKKDPQTQHKSDEHLSSAVKLSHVKRILKNSTKLRVSKDACTAVAAGLAYILCELMDGGKNIAYAEGRKKVLPKHINNALSEDGELNHIGYNWIIKSGGVRSNVIPQESHPKKNKE